MKDTDLQVFRGLFESGFAVNRGGMVHEDGSRSGGDILGQGLFESHLEELGYPKRDLKKLVHTGTLLKTTTRYKGGWRNTYVLIG